MTIPVGKQTLNGVILKAVAKPEYATKEISSVTEPQSLPTPLIELSLWLSDYYRTPLATVLQTVLPRGLTTNRRVKESKPHESSRDRTQIVLNEDQAAAVRTIMQLESGTTLLQGVTGSGKT